MKKHKLSEIKQWSEMYIKTLTFISVAKHFGIHHTVVARNLRRYKKQLNVRFSNEIKQDLSSKNLKQCIGCNKTKSCNQFHKHSQSSDGLYPTCKICTNQRNRTWDKNNPDKKQLASKKWTKNNPSKVKENRRRWHSKNKIKENKRCKQWRKNNPEKFKQSRKMSKAKHPHTDRKYVAHRRATDIKYKIASNLRSRLSHAIKRNHKNGSAIKDLGCSMEQLKTYLEKQFYPHPQTGEIMSWKNYGHSGWHIDHIIPLASFDITQKKELKKACNYTNLQPLWAEDHFRKSSNERLK
ncbi:hypothetical protein LCGC14_1700550 [marine sediment metagenome]|uniref:HNH nuclease domain-containing protein n=1 Tax=marine sediment metagenome TaxID=412755 RepID=A0A0F9KI31_9ZZZZ